MSDFSDTIKDGETRESLVAIRDFIVNYLEANRCAKCQNIELRSGDMAALLLRLMKVIEAIELLPDPNKEEAEDELASLRESRYGPTESEDLVAPDKLGTKSAKRRQGGRRARSSRGS